jgi:hypothetical protein
MEKGKGREGKGREDVTGRDVVLAQGEPYSIDWAEGTEGFGRWSARFESDVRIRLCSIYLITRAETERRAGADVPSPQTHRSSTQVDAKLNFDQVEFVCNFITLKL